MDIRIKRVRNVVIGVLAVAGSGVLAGSLAQRSKPDLGPWHTVRLSGEFEARDARNGFEWADYLAAENVLFEELEDKIVDPSRTLANPDWSRYAPGGLKAELLALVGWDVEDVILSTPAAYDLCYRKVYAALPACRNCICG